MSTPSECRELPLLEVFCHATRRCLIRQDSLLKCPSDSGGDFPQAIWPLRDSVNLDLTAPDDGRWSCLPLGWKCFSTWGDPFYWEGFCSLDIRRANFSVYQTNSYMQTTVFKQCKVYVCLEVLKMHFYQTKNFVRIWIQLGIYNKPYRSQDAFCNSMLSN